MSKVTSTDAEKSNTSSYRSIVKATSLLGGSSALQMLVNLVRGKVVAVYLGPAGVGIMGIYMSSAGLVSSLASAGMAVSGVREIAKAKGTAEPGSLRAVLATFRRLAVVLALLGGGVFFAVSPWLSTANFGDDTHRAAFALLAMTVTASVLSTYFNALTQASGMMSRLALSGLLNALIGSAVAVACFINLGRDGIVLSLCLGAAVQMLVCWTMARNLGFPSPAAGDSPSMAVAKRLLLIGGSILVTGLMVNIVAWLMRFMIIRHIGEDAAGLFQSAASLSAMFANYILGAMGSDFLPRLSATIHDAERTKTLVNQQTIVGLLMGLPGIAVTVVASPVLVPLLYSSEFSASVPLLQLLSAGVFGRLISWPLGFVLIASGRMKASLLTDLLCHVVNVALAWCLLPTVGIEAAGIAMICSYLAYTLVIYLVVARLVRLAWSWDVVNLVILSIITISSLILVMWKLSSPWNYSLGTAIVLVLCWLCFGRLAHFAGIGRMEFLASPVRRLLKRV